MREKTTITHEDFLELSSDIAEAITENLIGNTDLVCIWNEDDNGDLRLTDEAQDIFNEYLEIVQNCIHSHFKPTNN